MEKRIRELLPEIEWIKDEKLKNNVIASYVDALTTGGFQPGDMEKLPFTLLIQNCPFTYLEHVRGVTRVAKASMDEFNAIYGSENSEFVLDHDLVVAGALLHDVGKLVEYEMASDGTAVKSELGKDLRHPFSGTVIALRNGCPSPIAHIIANHAAEGEGTLRSPEGVIVNKADFINFETVKSFLGIK